MVVGRAMSSLSTGDFAILIFNIIGLSSNKQPPHEELFVKSKVLFPLSFFCLALSMHHHEGRKQDCKTLFP